MKKKVLLGMSGGVDSSVSAILLQEQGYDVIGVTMKLYEEELEGSCCNLNSSLDAKKICDYLRIPHYTLNFKEEFRKNVIQDFIENYANCRTPNPCIECNKYLKFGKMYQMAQELGCDYIATGHYAKVEYDDKYHKNMLKKANALTKEQSYVLYSIPQELLDKIIFPLGEFNNKDEIREIARKHNLPVANKPDSEDICFIPNGNYKEFLEKNEIKQKKGKIVLKSGEVVGMHNGLYNYTIGQRRGLGISYEVPLFVIGFNKEKNEVVVGREAELYQKEIIVGNVNWLTNIELPKKMSTKIRYSKKEAESTIIMLEDNLGNNFEVNKVKDSKIENSKVKDNKVENSKVKIVFDEPQKAPTPGQSAVFYIDDTVIGGGKII